ncbi:glycosyltransferase involved in cell wall biosynthesis [Pseudacidovorax intermedius]|uniref:Glycosyltransferase involved in cell wall biosynthesis n=1 Tax=Pseudacidovorax intermedius TaxID=433924 RepID=A0A370FK50_9BURK|nr:glycosyltransferase family 4 protein [Pseudacidovorax intermedius]RDI24958.1 glycosyltransferase involved in cell wall biosynthesis [Pseudacidovorax intermedius]
MKVLIAHNTYRTRGGEDAVVENERRLLAEAGNEVIYFEKSNDVVNSFFSKVVAAAFSIFSPISFFQLVFLIMRTRPNVVHVHNFFPQISPSIFFACRLMGVRSVLTLHNYRTICPTAFLMYNGKIETRSINKGPWWAVKKRVYRNSYFGTFFLAAMIDFHRRIGTWRSSVDRFIVFTEFSKTLFVQAGFPKDKLFIKPNFVFETARPLASTAGVAYLLYVGRLSEEKGLDVLLRATRALKDRGMKFELVVVGDGPLKDSVQSEGETLKYLGKKSSDEVVSLMRSALAVVMPSLWFEGMPMVLIESFSVGTPVIASNLGALAELVDHGETGLLFEPGNQTQLEQCMEVALTDSTKLSRMRANAYGKYAERYSAESNIRYLMEAYK